MVYPAFNLYTNSGFSPANSLKAKISTWPSSSILPKTGKLGKSGKEPILALRDLKTEEYLGGAAALSRHVSPFCEKTALFSMVGEKGEYLDQIKKGLPKNVSLKVIQKKKSPTILKRRFLDHVSNNKVLGVYKINDDALNKKQDELVGINLKKILPKYDLVIVSDYGHGFISNKNAKIICRYSKYIYQ